MGILFIVLCGWFFFLFNLSLLSFFFCFFVYEPDVNLREVRECGKRKIIIVISFVTFIALQAMLFLKRITGYLLADGLADNTVSASIRTGMVSCGSVLITD